MNKSKKWIITFMFSDAESTKYLVSRDEYWQVKNEANDIKDSWNFTPQNSEKIQEFFIKELNEK